MGAGHGHKLHYHGHSLIHRAPAHLKVVALVAFMLAVVATPIDRYAVFAGWAAVLLVVVAMSQVPPTYLARRMVVEVPFVVFALLLPFIATGPRTDLLGLAVSESDDVLRGLQRLRVPDPLVQIMGFMVRYLDVVTGEMGRMLTAMRSRGYDPRSPRHWPVLARSLGALFIRSYERGERVHLAMLSRGYTGTLPR